MPSMAGALRASFAVQNRSYDFVEPPRVLVPTLDAQIKKPGPKGVGLFYLAEREGFEPSVHLHARLISNQVHSTALPPLRKLGVVYIR